MNAVTRDMLIELAKREWPRRAGDLPPHTEWVDAVSRWFNAGTPDVDEADDDAALLAMLEQVRIAGPLGSDLIAVRAWHEAGCPMPIDRAPRAGLQPSALKVLEQLEPTVPMAFHEDFANPESDRGRFAAAVLEWRRHGSPIPGRLDANTSDLAALLVLLDAFESLGDPKLAPLVERAAIWVERARRVLGVVAALRDGLKDLGVFVGPRNEAGHAHPDGVVLARMQRARRWLDALVDPAAALIEEPAPLSVLDSFELLKRARRWMDPPTGGLWCNGCAGPVPEHELGEGHRHRGSCTYMADRREIDAFLGSPS